jgi:hypothetical protein
MGQAWVVQAWYYTDRLQARGAGRLYGLAGKTGRTQRQETLLQVRLGVVLRSGREEEGTDAPERWRWPGQQSRVPPRSVFVLERLAMGRSRRGLASMSEQRESQQERRGRQGRCGVKAAGATWAAIGCGCPIEDDEEF